MNNKLISIFLSAMIVSGVKTSLMSAPPESTYTAGRKSYPLKLENPDPEIEHKVFDFNAHTKGNAGLRSLILPGWGQHFNGEKRKGAVLFGTTLAAGALAYFYYQESSDSYDKYKNSGRINDSHYDDYERELTVSMAMGGMAAILWGYSIFNAFAGGPSPKTSHWHDIQLAMNPTGGNLTWQRKF